MSSDKKDPPAPATKMVIEYRVMARWSWQRIPDVMLYCSPLLADAEAFCWAYDDRYAEIFIETVWLRKGKT